MKTNKRTLHDLIIKEVSKNLDGYIETNKEYKYKGKAGECDIFLLRKGVGYVFEVKTHDTKKHRKKAREQLLKDIDYYSSWFGIDRFYGFYVYGDKNENDNYLIGDKPKFYLERLI